MRISCKIKIQSYSEIIFSIIRNTASEKNYFLKKASSSFLEAILVNLPFFMSFSLRLILFIKFLLLVISEFTIKKPQKNILLNKRLWNRTGNDVYPKNEIS